jgi:hypothetical protein
MLGDNDKITPKTTPTLSVFEGILKYSLHRKIYAHIDIYKLCL